MRETTNPRGIRLRSGLGFEVRVASTVFSSGRRVLLALGDEFLDHFLQVIYTLVQLIPLVITKGIRHWPTLGFAIVLTTSMLVTGHAILTGFLSITSESKILSESSL